jgi:Holliday junction resolvase RusA-like endonuclease
MNLIALNVNIIPTNTTHQSSLRILKGKGGKMFVGKYSKTAFRAWLEEFKYKIKDKVPNTPLDGPLQVEIDFYFPHIKSTSEKKRQLDAWKTTRPDLDNMEKSIFDCLSDMGFIVDDALICHKISRKKYSPNPRITIVISQKDA